MLKEPPGLVANANYPGFAEVSQILSELLSRQLPDLSDGEIASIQVTWITSLVVQEGQAQSGPRIHLLIELQDGRTLPPIAMTGDLRAQIRQRLLEEPLFAWGALFQWVGILIILATLILEKVPDLV